MMEPGEGTKYVLTHPFLCCCQSHSSFLTSASPPKITAVGSPLNPIRLHPGFQAHFPPGCLPPSALLTTRRWCNVLSAHVWPPNEAHRSIVEVEEAACEWQQSLQKQPTTSQLSGSGGAGFQGVTWEPLSGRWKTSCSECLASRRGNELGFMTWVAKQQEVRLWKCLLSGVCSPPAAFRAAEGYFSRKDSAEWLGRGCSSPTSHQQWGGISVGCQALDFTFKMQEVLTALQDPAAGSQTCCYFQIRGNYEYSVEKSPM